MKPMIKNLSLLRFAKRQKALQSKRGYEDSIQFFLSSRLREIHLRAHGSNMPIAIKGLLRVDMFSVPDALTIHASEFLFTMPEHGRQELRFYGRRDDSPLFMC